MKKQVPRVILINSNRNISSKNSDISTDITMSQDEDSKLSKRNKTKF